MRGAGTHPPIVDQQQEVALSADVAQELFGQLAKVLYAEKDWPATACQQSGADNGATPRQQENNFLATEINGTFYWYHHGLVFGAPVYDRHQAVDLDNCYLCGGSDGAELDLYGVECQVSAALCRRMKDYSGAAVYQALAADYFQRAAAEGYQYWPDHSQRPQVPRIV